LKNIKFNTEFTIYASKEALKEDVQELFKAAETARKNAYAPYSKFLVGAALKLENGEVITGSNQENAAYPSGLCAERTAIFYAGAQFPNQNILKMAISAGLQEKALDRPIPPCGACRQALVEYEQRQNIPIELYFMGTEGQVAYSESVENILPWIFDKNVL
jgi:cytidine deaminase